MLNLMNFDLMIVRHPRHGQHRYRPAAVVAICIEHMMNIVLKMMKFVFKMMIQIQRRLAIGIDSGSEEECSENDGEHERFLKLMLMILH